MGSPVEHIRKYHPELKAIRHDLHAHPELGFEETRTSALVADKLASWGIEVHRGLAKTGVVGVVKGRGTAGGRAIGLRADMDCLPVHETGSVSYRSRHDGRMHACGHDGHTTMLLGAARYLAETRDFGGTAYLIFQPAEEGGGGGQVMVKEGLFERFPANEVYALHNWPGLPPGKLAVRAGPVMAATDEIQITVRGRGGHAAMPHLVIDPVVAASHIITALQTIASRNVSPVDAVVVSIASMQTSQLGAFNVIPDSVRLIGTLRSFRRESRDRSPARLSAHHQQRARSAVRRAHRRAHLRQGERGHRRRSHHGRRRLLLHAARAPRRLRVARPGRRPRRLLPAQSELRLQR